MEYSSEFKEKGEKKMNFEVCVYCMYANNKLIKNENGLSCTWCRKHRQPVRTTDVCEFYKSSRKETEDEG